MYQHFSRIIIFILALCCITLDCNFAYGQKPRQRSSGQQKGTTQQSKPKAAQPTQQEAIIDVLPASTVNAALYSDPALMKDSFEQIFSFLGFDVQQCKMAVGIDVKTPLTTRNDSQAFIIVSPQVEQVVKVAEDAKFQTAIIENQKVYIHPNGLSYATTIGNDRLLLGTKIALSTVLASIKKRTPRLYQARPDLRPLLDGIRLSPNARFVLLTQEMRNQVKIIFDLLPTRDFLDAEAKNTLLNLNAVALDSQDGGKCAFAAKFAFSSARYSTNATIFLTIIKFLGSNQGWDKVDIKPSQNVVSVVLSRTSKECSLALISGRLRVVDPQDKNKVWNIDKVIQGKTEKEISTISVIPKDSPDKPVMILSINEQGEFSSDKAIRGSEKNLVYGKEYILGVSFKYKDHIDINNFDDWNPVGDEVFSIDFDTGCAPPTGNELIRETIRYSPPFVLKKNIGTNAQNIDFPLPIVMIHGIRSCWQDWDTWMGYLLNSEKLPSKYPKGYIVFTPTYHFVHFPREMAIKEITSQLDKDIDGIFSKNSQKPKLNFIAHSNGGVVIRLLTTDEYGKDWKAKINRIYTLGTPHSGSIKLKSTVGARFDLDPNSMAQFNEKYPTFNGVDVVAVGGTASTGNIMYKPNDGVVIPQESVFNIGRIEEKELYSNVFANIFLTPLPPTIYQLDSKSVTEHFARNHESPLYHSDIAGKPNFLETGRDAISMLETLIFSNMVSADLALPLTPSEMTVQNISEIKSQQTQESFLSSNDSLALVYSQEIQLAPNEQKVTEVPIADTDRVQFSFYAETKVEIALIDPEGKTIKPDTIKSYLGANHRVSFLGEYIVTIQNPKPGTWKLKANNVGKEGEFITSVNVRSDARFFAVMNDKQYAPSSQANLRARVFDNELSNVKVDAVIATVQNDSGKIINQITLSEKKPYMYQGAVIVPPQRGNYLVTFEARGTEKGHKFQRQFVSEFEVSGELSQQASNSLTFSLSGNLKTDVLVNAGDSVTISASGQVVLGKRVGGCSPDGRETSVYELGSLIVKSGGSGELVARHGVLLARINAQGNEKWIIVGSNKTFVAPNSGMLELQVNDKKYEDNQGKFDVQVRINRVK